MFCILIFAMFKILIKEYLVLPIEGGKKVSYFIFSTCSLTEPYLHVNNLKVLHKGHVFDDGMPILPLH